MIFGIIVTIFIYLFPVFAGILNLKYKSEMIRNGILVYCALVTALAWQVGADFNAYLGIIDSKTSLILTPVEPLTETIYFLTNKIGEPRIFWFVLALITYSSLFFFVRGLEESEKDGTIILFFLIFGFFGIALRQMTSAAVSLLAIQGYYEKQYKKAGFFLLFAWSIHKTAIMVPLIPIVGFVLKKQNKYILTLVPVTTTIVTTTLQGTIYHIFAPIPLLGKYWMKLMVYEEGVGVSVMTIVISIGFGLVYLFTSDILRKSLSEKNYEFYLLGIFGFGVIFGFTSIHVARLMVTFGATGLPAFTHFFRKEEYSVVQLPTFARLYAQSVVVVTVIFIVILLAEYHYVPYNISKDINWQSGDGLEYKLGDYERGEYRQRYPRNEFIETLLIPSVLGLLLATTLSYEILHLWKRMKGQNLDYETFNTLSIAIEEP
ncbi:MAG: EpsG family protein [Promethearchaeota archaeon]